MSDVSAGTIAIPSLTMRTFVITDPEDTNNPLSRHPDADYLIYHGTRSIFSQLIERQGLCYDGFDTAYGAELRAVVAACDELYFKPDGYAAAKGFSDRNWVYFSASFRSARGYALNAGGERIDGALRAAAFLDFARDEGRVELQAAHWARVLAQHGPHLATERVLANLRNVDLVRKLAEQVENARSALDRAARQGHPVVYAVRADRKWIYEDGEDAAEDHQLEPFGGIRLSAVPADRIVGGIEYPNGISPDSE